jgi:hypothetical protein
MGDWELKIEFHWPHHRFALGWDYISADEEYDYSTSRLYFFFITFTLDY